MAVMSPVTFAKDALTAQVAENIKFTRIRRGLSGRQLAEKIGDDGVSHTWVSSRETGDVSCTLKDIAALAVALDVSEAELLGFAEHALVRSEAREVDQIIRNEDREYAPHNVDAFLSGLGMLIGGMYATVQPRRRALHPPQRKSR